MCYGFYPYPGQCSPWGPYAWPSYPISEGWPSPYPPYGGMGQTPPYSPGGYWGQMPFPPGAGMPPFGFYPTPEDQIDYLRYRAQMLQEELNRIDNEIREFEMG